MIGLAGHLLRLWQQLKYATESSGLLSLPARLRIVGVLFDVSGLASRLVREAKLLDSLLSRFDTSMYLSWP